MKFGKVAFPIGVLRAIVRLAKESGEKAFGKVMYERAPPYITEKYKAQLQALYDDLDQP